MGELLLSPERIEGYKDYIQTLSEEDEEFAGFVLELEEIGLALEDIYAMISSKMGAAITKAEGALGEPYPVFYLWADMEPDMAEKAFETLLETTGNSEDLTREDQEIAGIFATRIRDNNDGSSAIFSRVDNRFLFLIGLPTQEADYQQAEYYEEKEIEEMGTFIQAQIDSGGEFMQNFLASAGVEEVAPTGQIDLQILGDVPQILEMIPQLNSQQIEAFNLQAITKLAIWSTFEEQIQKTTVFMAASEPREGLISLIDQEPFYFEAPSWVPTESLSFSSTSLDFEKMLGLGLNAMGYFMPQQVLDQRMDQANAQLEAMLQTDISSIIGSFGNRIHTLEFPIEFIETELGTGGMTVPQESKAFIVDFDNPEILAKTLEMIAPMAAQQEENPNGMKILHEQDFHGVRTVIGLQESTIAYGKGKLVFTQGKGTDSRVFSLLNNPPSGAEALVNDSEFREALEKFATEEGISFGYADGDRIMSSIVPIFSWMMQNLSEQAEGDNQGQLDDLIALFPTAEEFEGLLGTIITRTFTTSDGLHATTHYEYR